jgi:hypothetical protein
MNQLFPMISIDENSSLHCCDGMTSETKNEFIYWFSWLMFDDMQQYLIEDAIVQSLGYARNRSCSLIDIERWILSLFGTICRWFMIVVEYIKEII